MSSSRASRARRRSRSSTTKNRWSRRRRARTRTARRRCLSPAPGHHPRRLVNVLISMTRIGLIERYSDGIYGVPRSGDERYESGTRLVFKLALAVPETTRAALCAATGYSRARVGAALCTRGGTSQWMSFELFSTTRKFRRGSKTPRRCRPSSRRNSLRAHWSTAPQPGQWRYSSARFNRPTFSLKFLPQLGQRSGKRSSSLLDTVTGSVRKRN
jgi:hypothetical protein